MTNIHELPSQDKRYEAAGRWIARLDKGLSAEEEEAFRQWRAADPENEALLIYMVKLWDKMDSLNRLSELFPRPGSRRHASTLRRYALPIAASLLLAAAAGWWATLPPGPDFVVAATSEDVYETAIGEHSTVTLADGTELVLNTNSRIRVEYARSYRLLTLESGEVHVRVAEDPARPLSVIAGDNIVQAVGTAFNIEITNDQQIELVVTHGKVRVGVHRGPKDGADPEGPAVLPVSSVTVAAGEELILGSPDEEITEVSADDIEVKLSWRSGNLVFEGEPLEKAVEEIGRYTSVEFVFLDEDLKKVRIVGLFKAGDVDGLLAALRENFNVSYERVDDRKVLLSGQ